MPGPGLRLRRLPRGGDGARLHAALRQAITPAGLFARATAARRLPMFGMQIAGAALGGLLGGTLGLRATLIIGAAGLVAGWLLLRFSPVRTIRDLSEVTTGI